MKCGADDVHEGGFDAVAELDVGVGSTQILRCRLSQQQLGGASSGNYSRPGLLFETLKT